MGKLVMVLLWIAVLFFKLRYRRPRENKHFRWHYGYGVFVVVWYWSNQEDYFISLPPV